MADTEITRNHAEKINWSESAENETVCHHIAAIIGQKGNHRVAVPGGKTPLPIFEELSKQCLPWRNVSLMPTDDRIVPAYHPASNLGKLSSAFDGTPVSIKKLEEGMPLPYFELVWLGMGTDGHIASLFPKMNPKLTGKPAVVHTRPEPLPPEAPFERLSLNLDALTQTKAIMLVVKGYEKKWVLDDAIAGKNDLPITRLLAAAKCPITVFWSRS